MTVTTPDEFPYIIDRVKLRAIDEKRYQRMTGLALSRRLKRASDEPSREEEDGGVDDLSAMRSSVDAINAAQVPEPKQLTLLTQEHGFFGMHLIPHSYNGPVIITEGEFDAMAVHQETFDRVGYYVLSLPYGAGSVPDSLLKQLDRFSHIYLWLDADEPGQVGLQKIVAKLPLGRVRIISTDPGDALNDRGTTTVDTLAKMGVPLASDAAAPSATTFSSSADSTTYFTDSNGEPSADVTTTVEGIAALVDGTEGSSAPSTPAEADLEPEEPVEDAIPKDANEALILGYDLVTFIKNASVLDDERFDRFSGALRTEVFQRFAFAEQLRGYPLRSLPRLTSILKGIRLGELTIFSGLTGQGKTTILSQISIDLALQQVPVLWGSFEVKTSKLNSTMIRQYSGVDFRKNPERYDFFARHFEALPLYFLRAHGSITVTDLIHRMSTAVGRFGVQVIILDNLQFMLGDHGL